MQYFGNMKHNSAAPYAFTGIVKVTNYTKVYSCDPTEINCNIIKDLRYGKFQEEFFNENWNHFYHGIPLRYLLMFMF